MFIVFFLVVFANQAKASMEIFDDCNHLDAGVHYQLTQEKGYCLDTNSNQKIITFVNLSSKPIESADRQLNVSYLLPNEYVYTTSRLAVYQSENIVFSLEQEGILVARDRGTDNDIVPMALPVIPVIFIRAAAAGATLGIMDAVATAPNNDPTFRDVAIGAFSGALGGIAAPIMGGGFFGIVSAGSIGLSAKGGCTSCHDK
nr:hypothetical protein [uncultured Vibrio sp.]